MTKVAGRNLIGISQNVKTLISKVETLTKCVNDYIISKLWRNLLTNRIEHSINRSKKKLLGKIKKPVKAPPPHLPSLNSVRTRH